MMATLKMETMGCTKKRVGANRSVQIRTVDGQLLRRGCIVFCKLLGVREHSGVYVGKGKIVHLDGNGYLVKTGFQEFLDRLWGLNPAYSVYVACNSEGVPLYSRWGRSCADMAESRYRYWNSKPDYSFAFRNCHHFSGFCLLGYEDESEIPSKLLSMLRCDFGFSWLEDVIKRRYEYVRWIECDWSDEMS